VPKSPSPKIVAVALLTAGIGGFSIHSGWNLNFTEESWALETFGLPWFFVLLGVELRHEFTAGAFVNKRHVLVPALAAIFGIVFPALGYLAFTFGTAAAKGWLIPTATDATIALAVFAIFGKGLPSSARAFLLAVAIIDDCIGIVLLGIVFAAPDNWWLILATVLGPVLVWWLSRGPLGWWRLVLLAATLLANFWLADLAGLQPTLIAAVAGLTLAPATGRKLHRLIEVPVLLAVLPAFVFLGCAISITNSNPFTAVFWGVLARVPLKWLGLGLGALLGTAMVGKLPQLNASDYWKLAPLGGIGFTVSLFAAQLAFGSTPHGTDQQAAAILATVVATGFATVFAAATLGAVGRKTKRGSNELP